MISNDMQDIHRQADDQRRTGPAGRGDVMPTIRRGRISGGYGSAFRNGDLMISTGLINAAMGLAFLAVWLMAGDIVLHDRS